MRVKIGAILLVTALLLSSSGIAWAKPNPDTMRETIELYVAQQERLQGAFALVDGKHSSLRWLKLIRIHEKIGKTGNYRFVSADMRDVKSGDLLELDFDISNQKGELRIVDIRIRKENGKARYTYGENSNIVPVDE